eukprot:IDg830t1
MKRAKSSHCYVPMDTSTHIHFTKAQLHRLHRQFFHPAPHKLFNLLMKSRPEDTTPETLKILQEISKSSILTKCQHRSNMGYNTSMLGKYLHRITNRMLVDQGSALGKGESFASIATRSNVQVDSTGIEAQSSLGICERYHQPLRNTFRKMRIDFPRAPKELLLQLSVKAMNDTLGPEGIVPSLLVFDRAKMAIAARKEMSRHMAKTRVNRALRHKIPSAADRSFTIGDK